MLSGFFYHPLWNSIDRQLGNPYLKDLEVFVGGGAGHDWVSKAARAELHDYTGVYNKLERQFKEEPRVLEVVEDNLLRLTLLSGVERLLSLRQAYGGLKSRFTFADTNTAALQKIFNQGLFKGYFKGSLLNATQFITNWAHPLFYSQGHGYIGHFFFSSLFEVATYPIDTVKTLLYADINGTFKNSFDLIQRVYERNGLSHFYSGLLQKLAFNGALIYHLRNIYEQDTTAQFFSLPILAFSYGFLTLKTRMQLAGTELSFIEGGNNGRILANIAGQKSGLSVFRGVLPFLVLTQFFHYNIYALYSQSAQDSTLNGILHEIKDKFNTPKKEVFWN